MLKSPKCTIFITLKVNVRQQNNQLFVGKFNSDLEDTCE